MKPDFCVFGGCGKGAEWRHTVNRQADDRQKKYPPPEREKNTFETIGCSVMNRIPPVHDRKALSARQDLFFAC